MDDRRERLCCWGGADEWWAWPDGGEWLRALNGFPRADDGEPHALRPVIPIGPR